MASDIKLDVGDRVVAATLAAARCAALGLQAIPDFLHQFSEFEAALIEKRKAEEQERGTARLEVWKKLGE